MSDTAAPARGPGRPPKTDGAPRLVEVELVRKYCPKYLVDDEGAALPNGAEIKAAIEPGVYRLHPDDATVALQAGAAQPTHNTFRGL